MAKLSVSEAAKRLGVNVQRVHQRIADGSLPAVRIGNQWVVEEADVVRLDRRPSGRPLSLKSAWALAAVAALDADGVGPSERSRARARLREFLGHAAQRPVRAEEDAASLAVELRALMRNRAQRRLFRSAPRDLDDLRSEGRIILSGISLPDSGIASGDIVEGYIAGRHLDELVDAFLLSDARHEEANVVLHVVDPEVIPRWPLEPNDRLVLAADLAEHHRPREVARAVEIIREMAEQHPVLDSSRS